MQIKRFIISWKPFYPPSNNAKGSIIWRMNLENINDCNNPKEMARGEIRYF